jgi:hypothetical protein
MILKKHIVCESLGPKTKQKTSICQTYCEKNKFVIIFCNTPLKERKQIVNQQPATVQQYLSLFSKQWPFTQHSTICLISCANLAKQMLLANLVKHMNWHLVNLAVFKLVRFM